jgi:excisionase family DNA binding protein
MEKEKLVKPMTRRELAEFLSVTPQTISRYEREGRIKSIKLGGKKLFSTSEINNLLNS